MALPAAFTAMPRRNQLIILHGVPAVVAICLAWWTWSQLGALGRVDNSVDEGNKLPAALMRDDKASIWAQIKAKQDEIDGYQELINQGPSIKKTLEALKDGIKTLNERLPTESEKAEMREVLERLARDIPKEFGVVQLSKVSISDQGPGHGSSKEPRTVTYSVELLGDQDGIIKYIDAVERFQRFMVVSRVTITSGGFGAQEKGKMGPMPHHVSLEIETKVNSPSGAKP